MVSARKGCKDRSRLEKTSVSSRMQTPALPDSGGVMSLGRKVVLVAEEALTMPKSSGLEGSHLLAWQCS